MRRRITLAFVAVLAGALILAGTVSLYLVRHAASQNAQRTLLAQAATLAQNAKTNATSFTDPNVLKLIEHIAGIKTAALLSVNAKGHLAGVAPANIPTSSSDLLALTRGGSFSGSHNHVAYAAVPLLTVDGTTLALVLESPESFSADNVWYFLLGGGISLLVAVGLSPVVTRRIARRVNAVAEAAGHIAAGEFGTRVEVDPRDYPELIDLNASINAMAEDLGRAREAERTFLLSISHDLRTPLTSIRGYSEAIADGAVDDVVRAASVVVAESDRLERLIDDLLDLARLRARRFSFDFAPFELASVVRTTTEALPLRRNNGGARLQLRAPEEAIVIVADAHRVGQIIANLVENALKFATAVVSIELSTTARDASPKNERFALMTVEDDGPGIAPEDLAHIFEPLYTSDRAAEKAGTGLGLAIVAELTEAMHGTVVVDSPLSSSGGSRFTVRLPLGSTEQLLAPATSG